MTEISAKFFSSMILSSEEEPLDKQWADQRQAEWEKECANRAALLESLMLRRDWVACRSWINQWQAEGEASADILAGSGADSSPRPNSNERILRRLKPS